MKLSIKKIVVLTAMLSAFLTASAYDFIIDGIAYTITSFADLECSVVANDEPYRGEIIIPSTVEFNGRVLTVKSIGKEAFRDNEEVTAVSLPATIKKIETYAFAKCSNLTTIVCCEGLECIESWAFAWCSSLANIQIPSTLSEIGEYAFSRCSSLSMINISHLKIIEEGTFAYCSSLTNIQLGDSLSKIDSYAFQNCGVETFAIPNSVETIGDYILRDCINLKSFTIGNGIRTIDTYQNPVDGCHNIKEIIIVDGASELYFMGHNTFIDIPCDSAYVGRQISGPPPFHAHSTLRSIKFGGAVTSLPRGGISQNNGKTTYYGWLEDCVALEKIEFGGSMNTISEDFARRATSLKQIVLYGITTIGDNSFRGCSSLESIHVERYLKSIGTDAFTGCDKLSSIYLNSIIPPLYSTGFSSNTYLYCQVYIPLGTMANYKEISPWNNFWNITESIDCTSEFSVGNLKYEIISENNVMITSNTIKNKCELTIPETVEYYSSTYNVVAINDESFRNADSLISIVIPKSIQEVGNNVFDGCTNLRKVVIEYGDTPLVLGC